MKFSIPAIAANTRARPFNRDYGESFTRCHRRDDRDNDRVCVSCVQRNRDWGGVSNAGRSGIRYWLQVAGRSSGS